MPIDLKDPIYEEISPKEEFRLQSLSVELHSSEAAYFPIFPHWHKYVEMLYFTSGSAQCYISGEFIKASRGDLVFINPSQVHGVFSEEDQTAEYIVIKFDPALLHDSVTSLLEAKYVLPFTMAGSNCRKVFRGDELNQSPIPGLIERTIEEISGKAYGYEYALRINLCSIFLWILRDWHEKGFSFRTGYLLKDRDIGILEKVHTYVEENFQGDLSTYTAAHLCNMSYSFFSRHFRKITGKTFTEYVNFIRVTEAEKLLLSGTLDVTEVALRSGFSDTSYFIKQFRHLKSVTPKQYRKSFSNIIAPAK